MSTSVVLAGGGTGGHIEPALNLADELRRRDPNMRITALGTSKGLETTLVPKRGYPLELIPPVPLPRKPSKDLVTLPKRVWEAVSQTQRVLANVEASVLVGFGGYVSLPAYLAARKSKIPIVVHEANAKPGLANRVGGRMTPHVAENYAGSLPKAVRMGCPLRSQISDLNRQSEQAAGRSFFGLDQTRRTLFVFGGSQGARSINSALEAALPKLVSRGYQVLHAVGGANFDESAAPIEHYHPVPFVDRMDLAYAAADLAVCRSGAMTCAEVAAVGLPAIYVPYPIGNGEQRFNAEPVVSAGGGIMIADEDLTADRFFDLVDSTMTDSSRLTQMGQSAAGYGIADGAARLADLAIAASGEAK